MYRKKTIAVLAIVVLLLTTLAGCGSKEAKQEEYIGIISAMDNEIELLLSEAEIDHVDTIGGVDYHIGTLRGHPVIISKSGNGKVRASSQ